jgi:3-methylcrotonyl-CoA carboxylase beta subunit
MWPNARISVMGPEQAASVLTQVRADSYKERGKSWSSDESNKYRSDIEAQYNSQANAFYSSARLWDDGVIDPAHTRQVLTLAFRACRERRWPQTRFGVFRM